MDFKQLLPLLLKGKIGEREQAILRATESSDPMALGTLLTQMYAEKPKNADLYATLKRIMPAQTLGQMIKYFDGRK